MTVQRSRSLVLLVDDSPTQARRNSLVLEAAGFRVQLANNGREALEKARRWHPDVIVSDILMPVMDGFSLCREVRKDAEMGEVPIVLHTLTYVDSKDEELALAVGATRFVLKSSDPAYLVDEVKQALAGGHAREQAAAVMDNEAFLQGYSERLAAKLEDKVTELEAANKWLAVQHQETAAARDRLAVLLNVSQLAASSLDLTVMLGRVAERIVTALQVTYCRIGLVVPEPNEGSDNPAKAGADAGPDRLVFQAAYPLRDLTWEPAIARTLALAEAPVHRTVLSTRQPRVVELDAALEGSQAAISPHERDAAWLQPASSVLLLPMCQGDRTIGLIQIGEARASERSPITPERIELAQAMAAQIGVAVTNAHLHQARVEAEREVRALNEQLEQRVRERTRELEAANQELEAFSYSVSHDLRAPLRAMDGFSRILLERHAGGLSDDGRSYLDRIRGSAQRMSQLIDDLLTFARTSRRPLARRTIDLTAVVQEVLNDFASERQQRQLDEKVGDLPLCQADPTLMKQVYVNLLQNALKFTRRRETARIEVGAQTVNDEVVYYVKDNGAGFDMQYADKLFGVFQRLHRPTDFEGTGVGLAICQRIIHRHGGRIWAEAAPDQGATFFFTLGQD